MVLQTGETSRAQGSSPHPQVLPARRAAVLTPVSISRPAVCPCQVLLACLLVRIQEPPGPACAGGESWELGEPRDQPPGPVPSWSQARRVAAPKAWVRGSACCVGDTTCPATGRLLAQAACRHLGNASPSTHGAPSPPWQAVLRVRAELRGQLAGDRDHSWDNRATWCLTDRGPRGGAQRLCVTEPGPCLPLPSCLPRVPGSHGVCGYKPELTDPYTFHVWGLHRMGWSLGQGGVASWQECGGPTREGRGVGLSPLTVCLQKESATWVLEPRRSRPAPARAGPGRAGWDGRRDGLVFSRLVFKVKCLQ